MVFSGLFYLGCFSNLIRQYKKSRVMCLQKVSLNNLYHSIVFLEEVDE